MPLAADQRTEYQRVYRQRSRRHRGLSPLDMDVLRLAIGEFAAPEVAESLGISEEAAFKAFARVARFLAPTPASKLSIDPADCLPFVDEAFA